MAEQDDRGDEEFARAVLRQGWVTAEQLDACREAVASLRASGVAIALEQLLLARGLVTPDQALRARASAERPGPVEETFVLPAGYDYAGRVDIDPGMARGIKVIERASGRRCCLKFDVPELQAGDSPWGVKRERFILSLLESVPGVPTCRDGGVLGGRDFIVFDFPEAPSLAERLKASGRLSLGRVARLGGRLARAVADIHRAGVVWRDLKPSHLWDPFGDLTLTGFALALHESEVRELHQEGVLMGTPAYMAPEAVEGRPPTTAVDRYSLGVVLHEMATGRKPFEGSPVMELFGKVLREDPRPPSEINPMLPRALSDLILALLAKRPEDRPSDLEAVARQLDDFAAESEDGTGPDPDAPASSHSAGVGPGSPSSGRPVTPRTLPRPNFEVIDNLHDIQTGAAFRSLTRPRLSRPAAPAPPPRVEPDPDLDPDLPALGYVAFRTRTGAGPARLPGPGPAPAAGPADAFHTDPPGSIGPKFQHMPPPSVAGRRREDDPAGPSRRRIGVGSMLGPYRVVDRIGQGAFGTVFLAEDVESGTGRRVALKVPLRQRDGDRDLALYRHEAKLWRVLSDTRHPNVLELFDVRPFDGVIAFVMEYVDGEDLHKIVRGRRDQERALPLSEVVRIVLDVLDALRVVHRKGIYHGDLKPSNVLIRREDGAVKVSDFSVSRFVGPGGAVADGEAAGTPMYMAPEVWDGKPTLQSDIFALGVLFYEVITGRPPFSGRGWEAIRDQVRRGDLSAPPSSLRDDLPYEVERIVLRCLATDPADRYASVDHLAEDLRATDMGGDLVARLADCVIDALAEDDRAFLMEDLTRKGYRGEGLRTLVLEYCLDEDDPKTVLTTCFGKAGLARLARGLGIDFGNQYVTPDRYAQAILRRLGLGASETPTGLDSAGRLLQDLEHRLGQARELDEVASLVARAAREFERVLQNLVRFYGQFLFGRFHERALARVARKRLTGTKQDLARLTLGEWVGVLQALNAHLAGDAPEARHFRKTFRRAFAIPPELLAESRVVSVRNQFMHNHEAVTSGGLRGAVDLARPMIVEVLRFVQELEAGQYHPRIVVVESFEVDRFGRKFVKCRTDQGRVEKVFTNTTIDPSRHYFFHPTTNPTRIFPLIFPV